MYELDFRVPRRIEKNELEEQQKEEITKMEVEMTLSNEQIMDLKQNETNYKCEIEKMECVIKSLKESNVLMKEHTKDSVAISEQYQQNLAELQETLQVL